MATPEESQAQQERDTFKRHRCAEVGIKLMELDIYTLCLPHRFYNRYLQLAAYLGEMPLPRYQFESWEDIVEIVRQASELEQKSRPALNRKRRRNKGFWNLLRSL